MISVLPGRWGQAVVRVFLCFGILSLAACRLEITADSYGHVYTDLGGDCTRYCNYPVNAGEEFVRTLSAEARPGADFVRWEDSLGEEVAFCANPTQAVCPVEIRDLPAELEGIDVSLQARFQRIDGYNVSYVKLGNASGVTGYFRPVNLDYWVEQKSSSSKVYRVMDRSSAGLLLLDEELGRNYLLNLSAGQFSELGESAQNFIAAIVGVSSRPLGWQVVRVSYGNTAGAYAGEFSLREDGNWLYTTASSNPGDIVLTELARDLDTLTLGAESGEEYLVNLANGHVNRWNPLTQESPQLLGYVHDTRLPVNGWNVSTLYFSDTETGEVLGYFQRASDTIWYEYNLEGRIVATLLERERTAERVALEDQGAPRMLHLDFTLNMVALGPVTNLWPLPEWDIADAL